MGNFEARLNRQWEADDALTADLARAGLVVDRIHRQPADVPGPQPRLIVTTHDAHGLPHVAVVNQGPGERNEVFARLMTKMFVR